LQPLQMYLKVLQEQQTQVHSSIDGVQMIRKFIYSIWVAARLGMRMCH